MKNLHKLVLLTLVLISTALHAVELVGTTPGQFSVSESGAATYAVPIAIPAGTAGMQPSLALNYNSQAGSGIAGMGWNFSGVQAISRCGKSFTHDNKKGGIDFNADTFCLNGQRLFSKGGNEFRTEMESFSKITANGSLTDPSSFTAHAKSGEIMSFSKFAAYGKTQALTYFLTRVEDRMGNYMTYTYDTSNAKEYLLQKIDYTGSSTLDPYNSIEMVYEAKLDTASGYISGSAYQSTKRLSKIKVMASGSELSSYSLDYKLQSSDLDKSQLVGVEQCMGENGTGGCLEPIELKWTEEISLAFQGSDTFGKGGQTGYWAGSSSQSFHFTGDYNGDGLTDFMYWGGSSGWIVLPNNGNGFGTAKTFGTGGKTGYWAGSSSQSFHFTGDYNGDGLTDFMYWGGSSGWTVLISNGTSFEAAKTFGTGGKTGYWTGYTGASSQSFHFTGDYNGDGLTDFMYWEVYKGWTVLISNGTSFEAAKTFGMGGKTGYWTGYSGYSSQSFHFTGDYNGDGLTDFMYWEVYKGWTVLISNGKSFEAAKTFGMGGKTGYWTGYTGGSSQSFHFTGDYNGDGLTDFMYWGGSSGWIVLLNNGKSFESAKTFGTGGQTGYWTGYSGSLSQSFHFTGDYNGDGLTDFMYWEVYKGWVVLISNGGKFTASKTLGTGGGVGYSSASGQSFQFSEDFNGDGTPDIMYWGGSSGWVVLKTPTQNNLMNETRTSLGIKTTINYENLTKGNVYTKGTGATYPELDIQSPMQVVSSYSEDNGLGGQNSFSYTYEGLRVNVLGQGSRGFKKRTVSDNQTGVKTTYNYSQSFPYAGFLESMNVELNGLVLKSISNSFDNKCYEGGISSESCSAPVYNTASFSYNTIGKSYFPYIASSTESAKELDGSSISTTITSSIYDEYANPTQVTSSTDGFEKTVNNVYSNDTSNWRIGLATQTSVTSQTPSGDLKTRSSSFSYNEDGLLATEKIEPNTAFERSTSYTYDAIGNVVQKSVSAAGVESVSTSYTYGEATKRFITKTTNALGHSASKTYSSDLGLVKTSTGPNGLTTSYTYDELGRLVKKTRADGTTTSISYSWGGQGKYTITSSTSGRADLVKHYDAFGRLIRSETQILGGKTVYVDKQYDGLGRLSKESLPYEYTPKWKTYMYDDLGRITESLVPGSEIPRKISYTAHEKTMTDTNGIQTSQKSDVLGHMIETIDAEGNAVRYTYNALGNMTDSYDIDENHIQISYDIRGRKTSMDDPDMGHIAYTYDGFDRLVKQVDARGLETTYAYDKLGRKVSRTSPEGTTVWNYDEGNKAIGKLSSVNSYDGFSKEITYNNLGLPISVSQTIDGVEYTASTTYDALSRPLVMSYPKDAVSGELEIKRVYDTDTGTLTQIRNNDTDKLYWELDVIDETGHIFKQSFGNGLKTTKVYNDLGFLDTLQTGSDVDEGFVQNLTYYFGTEGELQNRYDENSELSETFDYDDMYRLVHTQLNGVTTDSLDYDDLGNMVYKESVGDYLYGNNAGPHAVTQAGANTYAYDASGQMISGDKRILAWTSFNKPSTIRKGRKVSAFTYDDSHKRIIKTTGSDKTIYVGSLFEKITKDGMTEYNFHISNGKNVIAIEKKKTGTGFVTSYLHRDHLGSVDTITDENGNIKEKLSFSAFGERRNSNWSSGSNITSTVTTRGFTGHEHDDELGLINMKGRIYDAKLGRFISADPFIQAPSNTQSLNRYTYVFNNPLSYTDPSGYFGGIGSWAKKAVGKKAMRVIKDYAKIHMEVVTLGQWNTVKPYTPYIAATAVAFGTAGTGGPAAFSWAAAGTAAASGAAAGATAGFTASAMAGQGFQASMKAGLKGGIRGAASAAIMYGVGSFAQGMEWAPGSIGKVGAHAIGGGIVGELNGGSFKDGAMGAAFSQAIMPRIPSLGNYTSIAAGMVGGIASKLGGGEFITGALSAFVADIYNRQMHEPHRTGADTWEDMKQWMDDKLTEMSVLATDATTWITNENDRIMQGSIYEPIGSGLSRDIPKMYSNAHPAARMTLDVSMSIVEFGLAPSSKVYDFASGFYFNTVPISPAAIAGNLSNKESY